MIREYLFILLISFCMTLGVRAQQIMRFVDLPLSLSPDVMVEELQGKGMHLFMGAGIPYTYRLTGGNNAEPASVNLLVLRGKIIGGDVTEDKYPGVIRSFSGKIYNAHDK